ncbi:receptor-transporting protein 3-like [Stegastes partitus]|uniref:Receptor-transporting protein 3-like n=1 Tax=Stegastes partitus TaxID=144197 RepID=A0A3B5A607_9TELE|nr:PREDICTED: receptor-transporting protein 3-like [Stegastes partitus]
MASPDWIREFQLRAKSLREGHSWRLEFDGNIVPNQPNPGWKKYIRNTSARFKCSECGRSWPSNWVTFIFHMRLADRNGTVKVRSLRQNCKNCYDAPMEEPSVSTDNIGILMENLMEKIRIKCYHEDLGEKNRPARSLDVQSPHEPSHCEACRLGICTRI